MPPALPSGFFTNLPLDWVVIALVAVLLVIFTLRAGTRVAVTVSLTFPVVAFALNALSNTAFISSMMPQLTSSTAQLLVAGVLFAALFFLISRILSSGFSGSALPLSALLTGAATIIITVVFLNEIIGSNPIWHFGPQVQALFGPAYKLFWLLGAYIVLAFARR